MIQLPGDVVSVSYRQSGFQYEQIFKSEKHGFTGSELEFLNAGLAYRYTEIDKFTRRVIP